MPTTKKKLKKFRVVLRRTVVETLTVEVKARDAAHASELAHKKANPDTLDPMDGDDWEYWDGGIQTNEVTQIR